MSENLPPNQQTPTGLRFRIGLIFFVLGWICPLFIPLVTKSNLSAEIKTLLSGFMILGAPEIFSFISIVFMGKSGFNYIKSKIFSMLRMVEPKGRVSRMRYRIGLVMLLCHIVFANVIFYGPHLIVGYSELRVTISLTADFLFVITLYVLGGDFWEKVRSLFIYEAKALIPEN